MSKIEDMQKELLIDREISIDSKALEECKEWFENEASLLEKAADELKELQEQFELEKKQFHEEMEQMEHKINIDRKRLAQDNIFFDQKMKILQSGFEQLESDKRKFDKQQKKFKARKDIYDESQSCVLRSGLTEILFCGVNSFLALKKRYKDLIKMYHPDNVAGDHEMVQFINKEYEELKKAYEVGKQA